MKTNVSIKFNSIEEYREIEKKLIELGYKKNIFSILENELVFNNSDYRFNIEPVPYKIFKVAKGNFYQYDEYNNINEILN